MGSGELDSQSFALTIRVDDGTLVKPDEPSIMDAHPWLLSVKRVLHTVLPGDRKLLHIVGPREGF